MAPPILSTPRSKASSADGGAADGAAALKKPVGKLTRYTMFVCVAAAFGGLTFGYDIGVSGGVTSNRDFLKMFFPGVYCAVYDCSSKLDKPPPNPENDPYCKYDNQLLQLFTSSLYIAGIVASLFAGTFCRLAGRRAAIAFAGATFCLGAALSAGAVHIAMVVVGRVLLGVGVGIGNTTVPLYLSEMAPPHVRGALNILFQLATTIGILVAQLINLAVLRLPFGWRLSLAGAGIPAVLLLAAAAVLPDTPVSLHARGYPEDALRVLERSRCGEKDDGGDGGAAGREEARVEMAEIVAAAERAEQAGAGGFGRLFTRGYAAEATIAVFIPIFQQLTGINFVMFFATALFTSIGSTETVALIQTVVIGVINVLATLIAIGLVDRAGRRPLLFAGGLLMGCSQFSLGIALRFLYKTPSEGAPQQLLSKAQVSGVLVIILVFVIGFALSWGPLGWLIPSEVQPIETRAAGVAVSTALNLALTFAIAQAFLTMLCHLKWGVFVFFGACIVAMSAFVWLLVPETKGIMLEDMAALWEAHPVWRRVIGKEARERGSGSGRGGSGGGAGTGGNDNDVGGEKGKLG